MEWWNHGILAEGTLGRDERLLVQGTQTRAPPIAGMQFSHQFNIPIFHYSSEVIGTYRAKLS